MLVLVLALVACGFGAHFVAAAKNRHSPLWFFAGLLMGMVGILLALVVPARRSR
jgi:hypothetical protein